MIGLIIGDIVGSVYEHHPIKTKEFPLFQRHSHFTDDTVLGLAIAACMLNLVYKVDVSSEIIGAEAQRLLIEFAKNHPYAGYGSQFKRWVFDANPKPYFSYGNGAPMRIASCGMVAKSEKELKKLVHAVTRVTHNHEESLKAAEAVAMAIYLARRDKNKEAIKTFIMQHYYSLKFSLDAIRPFYSFDVTSQGTTPQALQCFFEASSYEETIRNAVSLGGDSDTLASIAGAIAGEYYGVPEQLKKQAKSYLTPDLLDILNPFEDQFPLSKKTERSAEN